MRRAALALPFVFACAEGAEIATESLALRPDQPRTQELFRYDAGDVVEAFDSAGGRFKIHFTRAGRHAVALADVDGSGVPDAVERVAALYDEILAHDRAEGWRDPIDDGAYPDNGGDDRFDVYLVDFARAADGTFRAERCSGVQCAGYMVQENDFAGYGYPSVTIAERTVASHELFHAVQAAYDGDQGSVLAEGTAEWASEQFDPSLDDMEAHLGGYFMNAGRSIDVPLPGPVDPFSYGSAILFQFLGERHGPAIIRELYERLDGGGRVWKTELAALLELKGTSFAAEFAEFAAWNLYTGRFAAAGYGYADAASYPRVSATSVSAPVREEGLRVFYASEPVYSITTGGRDPIEIALSGADLDGLRLVAAPIRGGRLVAPPITGDARVSVPGAEGVLLSIVNTNLMGSSKRPTLCAGTAAELDDCLGVAPDAGPAAEDAAAEDAAATPLDAGAASDAGVAAPVDAGETSPPEAPSSCGAVGGSFAWTLLGLRRARRRDHCRA